MKKNGFTMIELIFVIVVLGIVASIAMTKLAATRIDAKVSKVLQELAILKRDMSEYYTAHGTYNANPITHETNVQLFVDNFETICSKPARKIPSNHTYAINPYEYYYCVPDNNGILEPLVSLIVNDINGTITFFNLKPGGDIGKAVQSVYSYQTLISNTQNGGGKVNY